ncbi:MAG: SAM-dependent methyltransferase [Roseovarius sp.]|nr:SAM-dependent methyltransferase [Roseovarius sp.]
MSALFDLIAARIRADGPMALDEYMALCLMHPEHGYYATRDPLGASGDFITAPEISQMFGELLGLSLAQAWLDQGAPAPVMLAEAGPGRGTLMADVLRATRAVPGFHKALTLHLVETSPAMRDAQRTTLAGHAITFHDTAADLPETPLYLLANEFFDALPVRQLQRDGAGWRERCVGLRDGTLHVGVSAPKAVPALDHRLDDTRDGDIVELCPAAQGAAREIGARIAAQGGAALIVDYGDWRALGDTFQALHAHDRADPLAAPGRADLTAHVDFEALAKAAAPAAHSRLATQGVFLERLGITARAQSLARRLEGDALKAHVAAHRRLTHPDEMGTLFKVLGLFPEGHAPPPGLEP